MPPLALQGELVVMADHGSESPTFGQLFDAHAEALRRYARRIVCSREAAEDLVQEVFFRLWRGWETVETGPGIRAYLYFATPSRALNYLQHEETQARAPPLAFPRGMTREEPPLPPE